MSDVIDSMITAIKGKQAPLFDPPAHIPHLRQATQPQAPRMAPRVTTFITRECKFCGHKCHGNFALAQHLSEHVNDNDGYTVTTARKYDKRRHDALTVLYREIASKYQTEDEHMDAMVPCDKFAHDSTIPCKGEYLDGGHPHAWVYHILRCHPKWQLVDEFAKEDWEEFKNAYNKAIPELERAYTLVQGRRTYR